MKLNKKFLLTESKKFCIIPWIHTYVDPTSEVRTCCMGPDNEPIGDLDNNTLKEVWNNNTYKELRLALIDDKEHSNCRYCYSLESAGATTLRQTSNKNFGHHFNKVETTNDDGTVDYFELPYLDIRWSNVCNLKCRSCGWKLSSTWVSEMKARNGSFTYTKGNKTINVDNPVLNPNGVYEELEPIMDSVESIYFAGGEPLMLDEHYHMLDNLINLNKTDIDIVYSTNMSKLTHKKWNVIDYWKKFNSITIYASLDGMNEQASYIRSGTKWENILNTIQTLQKECPQHEVLVVCTLSILNCYHIIDFYHEWVKQGYIKPEMFKANLLFGADYYRIDILPEYMRLDLIDQYNKLINDAITLYGIDDESSTIISFNSAINMLQNPKFTDSKLKHIRQNFVRQTNDLDQYRNETFSDVFPELGHLLDEFNNE